MPSLPHNPHSYASGLRSYLESALPDSRLTEASVAASYDPLLLLRTDHVLAAFAFSNGDVRESYKTIYESFKSYYIEQKGQWDRLDLAFVFCVRPELPNLDDFCSTVETDVYFCRKFVVPLAPPLGASLARLPFLPLTPLNGQSLRPPSAQTFLQRCGVPAVLAKYLVVQRERGPQKIVEDCINGDFGDPKDLVPVTSTPVVQSEHGTEPIRLDAVTIKNFRAYRKPQTFAFGTDVTVLYGANGFGKTSFFDAVDFAATGEIGRIKPHGDEHFKKMAPHLDSTPEESTVSLSFWFNGALRKIARTVSDRKRAMLDGISTDRKGVLAELTGGDFPAADRVENFVSLFRATHLFNQEQQELTKDFQDDCRLPSEIVARMLAFEDYASALSKAAKVREVLDSVTGGATAQINELSEQIADEKKELERLGKTVKEGASSETLETELKALLSAVRRLGIAVESEKINAAVVRGWRASITARLEQMKLPSDATEQLLLSRIAEESKIQAEILPLRDSASNLELALDTATTSAALTQLRQNVRNKEKVASATTRTRDQHQPWIKYFTDLSRLVSSQQSEAIANFTREYGPRTSVIQRRLRSVYGFDELEITSHESEIRVRVKRHGEVLRPTDFFSQSQQQTLFLGLFLTACISQTWSAFSPVFLDDPVTHFDDLNTYAFLDLIVGLLEPGAGSRQFVISTCDEKLLQLARQKFRHLGKRAKFYRFAAISEDGPIVDEVA